jgi:O-antigen/teichoic acid export membrane protein
LPLALGNYVVGIMFLVIQWMLACRIDGASELGIYYAVMNFQVIMSFLPVQMGNIFLPLLSELSLSKKRFFRITLRYIFGNGLLTLLLIIPFISFPKYFMNLYGIEYSSGSIVLCLAAIYVFLNVLCTSFWHVFIRLV